MTKIIACIMVGNCEKYIELCIKAIEPQVDEIVICLDTYWEEDLYAQPSKTLEVLHDNGFFFKNQAGYNNKKIIITRDYEHDLSVKNANSNQRNFYLDYLKKKYMDDWVLCLDADEIVDENFRKGMDEYLKELTSEGATVLSPKMEHFIQDFAHVDNTNKTHYVPHRLFKITGGLYYPNGEHVILHDLNFARAAEAKWFTIYHLAYAKEMFYLKDRYVNHKARSNIHSQDFLQQWYYNHITGAYPKRDFDIHKMPRILKDYFMIDDDYFYFQDRKLNVAHFIDATMWRMYFKPKNVLLVGDGLGVRTFACICANLEARGFDISEYAVKHNVGDFPEEIYWQDNLLELKSPFKDLSYDLVVCYDVLEHIDEKDITAALKTLYLVAGKHLLISVPMIGDPNLMADDTHKIFWTREQWEKAISDAGFVIKPTPSNFLYQKQLIIGEKINGNS